MRKVVVAGGWGECCGIVVLLHYSAIMHSGEGRHTLNSHCRLPVEGEIHLDVHTPGTSALVLVCACFKKERKEKCW